jgi:hypothetical protein
MQYFRSGLAVGFASGISFGLADYAFAKQAHNLGFLMTQLDLQILPQAA